MSRNQKENIVLVFGGQTLNGLLLNDCWTLLAASASLQSPIANLEYKTEYVSPKHEAKPLSISILTKPLWQSPIGGQTFLKMRVMCLAHYRHSALTP
jgi:hypothetical protein